MKKLLFFLTMLTVLNCDHKSYSSKKLISQDTINIDSLTYSPKKPNHSSKVYRFHDYTFFPSHHITSRYMTKDSTETYSGYVYKTQWDSTIISEGLLLDGVRSGQWIKYNNKGVKEYLLTYENGILHGPAIKFYPDSTIHIKAFFKNNGRDSLTQIFDSSGVLQAYGNYSGDYFSAYPDGLWSEDYGTKKGYYVRGAKRGIWLENGKEVVQFPRRYDKIDSSFYNEDEKIWEFIDEYGKFVCEGNFKQGKKDSLWVEDHGMRVGYYKNGARVGKWIFTYNDEEKEEWHSKKLSEIENPKLLKIENLVAPFKLRVTLSSSGCHHKYTYHLEFNSSKIMLITNGLNVYNKVTREYVQTYDTLGTKLIDESLATNINNMLHSVVTAEGKLARRLTRSSSSVTFSFFKEDDVIEEFGLIYRGYNPQVSNGISLYGLATMFDKKD